MHKRGKRVLGPYKDRKGFRVVVIEAGQRRSFVYETQRTAEKAARLFKREIETRESLTIEEAIEEFLRHLLAKGNRKISVKSKRWDLKRFFPDQEEALLSISPKKCEEIYEDLCQEYAVDTHRQALATAKSFFSWCEGKEFIRENPARHVQGRGRKRRGKKQLRIDEARLFTHACISLFHEGRDGAIGCLLALLLGLRASEILGIRKRDIDDGGRILWVEGTKTARSRRQLLIPPVLQELLQEQLAGKDQGALIFGKRPTMWLWRWTRNACKRAGVPIISTHSLRGLHATLATEHGATSLAVSSALGHATIAMTEAHYTDRSTQGRVKQSRVLSVIEGGKTFRNRSAEG